MTIDELIERAERTRDAATDRRIAAERDLSAIRNRCVREDRNPSTEEETAMRSHLATIDTQRDAERDAATRVKIYQGEKRVDAEMDRLANMSTPGAEPPTSGERSGGLQRWKVGDEPSQYHADNARQKQPTFLGDLYASQIKRDPAAGERLARHGREVERTRPDLMSRAAGSGAVSGFVPPQYLSDLFAEYARAGRPVADLCNRSVPLPEQGMTAYLPRITTATSTAVQTAENASVSNTDPDDTLLAAPIATIAGYVDMSRQAIERGALVEQVVFADLAADYNSKLDAQVINGSGSSGQHTGVLNVGSINTITYTDASPTVAELWPKLADAVRQVTGQRFTGPTAFVMTPAMWGWIMAAVDSTGRPLIDTSGNGQNSAGVGMGQAYDGARALLGVPVVLSGNVPVNLGGGTNETRILAADWRDVFLMEDNAGAPVQLRFDDVLSGSLGVRLLAYGYSALFAGRQPKAISAIAGTGLIPQAL